MKVLAQSFKLNQEEIARLNDKELGALSEKLKVQEAIAKQEGERLAGQTDIGKLLSEEVALLKEQGATQNQINDLVSVNLAKVTDMTEEQKALVMAHFDEHKVIKDIGSDLDKELKRREDIQKSLGISGKLLKGMSKIAGPFAEAFGLDSSSSRHGRLC